MQQLPIRQASGWSSSRGAQAARAPRLDYPTARAQIRQLRPPSLAALRGHRSVDGAVPLPRGVDGRPSAFPGSSAGSDATATASRHRESSGLAEASSCVPSTVQIARPRADRILLPWAWTASERMRPRHPPPVLETRGIQTGSSIFSREPRGTALSDALPSAAVQRRIVYAPAANRGHSGAISSDVLPSGRTRSGRTGRRAPSSARDPSARGSRAERMLRPRTRCSAAVTELCDGSLIVSTRMMRLAFSHWEHGSTPGSILDPIPRTFSAAC